MIEWGGGKGYMCVYIVKKRKKNKCLCSYFFAVLYAMTQKDLTCFSRCCLVPDYISLSLVPESKMDI